MATAVSCAISIFLAGDASGQPVKRKKVGVALAGGAALGLSHIGVLQWLEENRIPIDFIAGTSMGGLVAGIHASGLDSAEMIELVADIDWRRTLAASTPYSNLSFRRKEDAAQFPMAFELGLKNRKLNLPSGLSPGEGVALVIGRFAAPYGDTRSFDDLPTPFRCIASDLVSGKGVVFDRGSLFDALRASMSLPAIFAPVRKDGMVLVDGGLTNNLPVDIVRAMGADIVIAVALDVPKDPKAFQSLLGIAGQSISYLITANERPNLAAADIAIMPSLKGMTTTDYLKWEQFRQLGYAAAGQKAAMLKQFQLSESDYAAHVAARRAKRKPDTIRPSRILVEGDVPPRLQNALAAAVLPEPGKQVDRAALEEQMEKLAGTGRYASAWYEFRKNEAQETLVVKVAEKAYGPPLLRPSILLDGANGEGLRFGVGARLTYLDFGGPASEWRTDLSIGTFNRLQTEYYYRIRGGKWFVAPRIGLSQDPFPLYDRNGNKVVQFTEKNYGGGADFGYAFGRKEELRIGHQIGYLNTSLNTGLIDPASLSGRYGYTHVTVRRDSRDNPLIPLSGTFAWGQVSWFNRSPLTSRQFPALEGSMMRAMAIPRRMTVLAGVAGAVTDSDAGLASMFRLGGLARMSALGRNQMLGNRMYYGQVFLLRPLTEESSSALRLYGVIGYEAGRAWFRGETIRPRHDGLIGVAGTTPLGALFLGGAIGDQGDRKILFRVGRVF